MIEDDFLDLLKFEDSERYDDRQKAALAYTNAIVWDLATDDDLWDQLHTHFSEPELVELGYFIAITMGQQRWLRTLNIEHHVVLAKTSASLAPGKIFRSTKEKPVEIASTANVLPSRSSKVPIPPCTSKGRRVLGHKLMNEKRSAGRSSSTWPCPSLYATTLSMEASAI